MLHRARVGILLLAIALFALLLIVMGLEGSAGKMLCVLFAPGRLSVNDTSGNNGSEAYSPGSESA